MNKIHEVPFVVPDEDGINVLKELPYAGLELFVYANADDLMKIGEVRLGRAKASAQNYPQPIGKMIYVNTVDSIVGLSFNEGVPENIKDLVLSFGWISLNQTKSMVAGAILKERDNEKTDG